MCSSTADNPWRLVEWSNETGRPVKRLAFHVEEAAEVLDLPFPAGAVCREPVTLCTLPLSERSWFRRRFPRYSVGDVFREEINHGKRLCKVLAVDVETGLFLYEYEMPGGRVFLRISNGEPVSRRRLSLKWRRLLEE